jgi:hypothetical protein
VFFLAFLVLELAVVHQLAHRRLRGGCDFDQIKFGFLGALQRVAQGNDAELFAFTAYQPDFTCGDFTVDPGFFFLSYSKFS